MANTSAGKVLEASGDVTLATSHLCSLQRCNHGNKLAHSLYPCAQYVSGTTSSCAIAFDDAGTNRLTGGSFGLGVPFLAAYPAVFMLPSPTQANGTAIACLSGSAPVRTHACFCRLLVWLGSDRLRHTPVRCGKHASPCCACSLFSSQARDMHACSLKG